MERSVGSAESEISQSCQIGVCFVHIFPLIAVSEAYVMDGCRLSVVLGCGCEKGETVAQTSRALSSNHNVLLFMQTCGYCLLGCAVCGVCSGGVELC